MRDTAFTAFLCLAVAGCSDADAEKLRRVGDKTYDRAASIVQQTWDELGRTLLDQQAAPVENDLNSKVQLRLKWERELMDLPITASVVGDVVTLKGTVKTKEQKERAEILASSTVGVSKVNDEIVIAEKEEKGKEEGSTQR